MKRNYKIADHVFEIDSKYDYIHDRCKDYISDQECEYCIKISKQDIDYENELALYECQKEGVEFVTSSDEIIEFLAIYRKIVEYLFQYDILLLHGSCIAVDNKGYVFIAKSGTGKSTHSRMWRQLLEDKAMMVNDDKPLIKIMEDGVIAYGTPWNGKHHLGNNIRVPLRSIAIIKQGKVNKIQEISLYEAYPMLLQQVYRLTTSKDQSRVMELIDKMGKQVKLFALECDISMDAAKLSYETMRGE